jgi:hypothetical protein
MSDSIPVSLKYGASQSQARVVRNTIMPLGNSSGTTSANSSFRFKLPEKSLVDLRSLSFYFDYTLSGLTDDAANYSNALIPASYKIFNSVKFYVSGALASNGLCNHYDMAYHALARASASVDWCNSRISNGYQELMESKDALGTIADITARPGGATSRFAHMTYDDVLGLPNSKNHVIDTSLFGSIEIELTMASNNNIKCFRAGTVSAANLQASLLGSISSIQCMVDTVVSISPLYVSLLAERLQVDTPIRIPFQSLATQVQSNTGSNRITLNSSCVDAILVATLASDPNTFAPNGSQTVLNSTRYKYDSGRVVADANTGFFQIQVGSESFPRQPLRADRCADLTTNSIFGNSAKSTNMLYAGLAGAAAQNYNRLNYLAENFVVIQKFGLESEGWASGLLQGISCNATQTDFVIQTTSLAAYIFVCALMTSQLVFNPATSSVSVEQ